MKRSDSSSFTRRPSQGSLLKDLGRRRLRRHKPKLLGRAWPGGFQQGAEGGRPAGSKYSVVGYGLYKDFRIVPVKTGD